ncbi:hypothetical protein IL306_011629 [Fusarium sp. DS 682]|nr:hypothetical protein IL306_011629 [Fusarium sp. DS 682]
MAPLASPRRSERIRQARLPLPTPSPIERGHPDDGYRMLRLRAAIPAASGSDEVVQQQLELCFHADFEPDSSSALSLHLSDSDMRVTLPDELASEPPPSGLIVDAGNIDLSGHEPYNFGVDSEPVQHEQEMPLGAHERPSRVMPVLTWLSILAMVTSLIHVYIFVTTGGHDKSQPPPLVKRAFPPLEYVRNMSIAMPLIACRLMYFIDRIPYAEPNSIQPFVKTPRFVMTNIKVKDLVEDIFKTVDSILGERIQSFNYDDVAICNHHSRGSVKPISSIVGGYTLKAEDYWAKVQMEIRGGWGSDLLHEIGRLESSLEEIYLEEAHPLFPTKLLEHYQVFYDFLWARVGKLELERCDSAEYLADDYILHPFCPFIVLVAPKYSTYDDLISVFRQNLTSWILDMEKRRLPPSGYIHYAKVWDGMHPFLGLAYYVTGLHTLASYALEVAREVWACRQEWEKEDLSANLWTRLAKSFQKHDKFRWRHHVHHDPDELPDLMASLEEVLNGPLDRQVTRVLDGAMSIIQEWRRLDIEQGRLSHMMIESGWEFVRDGGRFPSRKEQLRGISEALKLFQK